MLLNKSYQPEEINFSLEQVASRQEPKKVLMCTPDYFNVIDVKNPHMEGHIGSIDKARACDQWNAIKAIYQNLVKEKVLEDFLEIPGAPGCEDMVFAANQSFPWRSEDKTKEVVLSNMKHSSRQMEVPYFQAFYSNLGYKITHLKETKLFEGMGDTIPHPGKNLLYGGFGHRSDTIAYQELAALLKVPVVTLELEDERFYHLDTCFLPLDQNAVLLYPGAFTKEGLIALKKLFSKVIEVPLEEAEKGFALNAHVITNKDKKVAIIEKGNKFTNQILNETGFKVFEVDTSEYKKSGGSVFCMKMMLY